MSKRRFRKSNKKKNKSALALAKSNKRRIKQVFNMNESKYHILSQTLTPFSGVIQTLYLNGVPEGTNVNDRVGLRYNAQYLSINLSIMVNDEPLSRVGRIMIYRDDKPRGVNPVVADLLADVSTQAIIIQSTTNPATFSRFKILKDINFRTSAHQTPLGGADLRIYRRDVENVKQFKFRIPLHNKMIQVGGPNGTVNEAVNCGYFMTWMVDPTGGIPGNFSYTYQIRFTYKDA